MFSEPESWVESQLKILDLRLKHVKIDNILWSADAFLLEIHWSDFRT